MRKLAHAALVALLSFGLVVVGLAGGSAPAMASTLKPDGLNVLPSTVTGALGSTTTTRGEQSLAMLWQYTKKPEFWKIAKMIQDGVVPSPEQSAVVAAEAKTYAVPATKMAKFLKVTNGVGAALTALELGGLAGGGISRMMGMDVEGTVCAPADPLGEVMKSLSGADCAAWANTLGTAANADAVAGVTGGLSCFTSGSMCIQIKATTPTTTPGYTAYCFAATGPNATGEPDTWVNVLLQYRDGGTAQSSLYRTDGRYGRPACKSISNGGLSSDRSIQSYSISATVPQQTINQSSGDPERRLGCKAVYTSGLTLKETSQVFRESDKVIRPPLCPSWSADPNHGVLDRLEVTEEAVDGTSSHTVATMPATPEFQSASGAYPECMTGACILDLYSVTSTGLKSCLEGGHCDGWFQDPDRDTNYQCRYGKHTVSLSECNVYATAWDPERLATGDYLADPITGQPQPGVKPVGQTGAGAIGTPVQDPSKPRQCFPEGWAVFNPIEWVMKPVGCALQDAFVPRPAEIQKVATQISTSWDTKPFAQIPEAVNAWGSLVPSLSGCSGIQLRLNIDVSQQYDGVQQTLTALNACPGEPLEPVAIFTKVLGSAAMVFYTALAVTRYLAAVVEYKGVGSAG